VALLLEPSGVGGQFRQGEIFSDFWEYSAKTPPLEMDEDARAPLHAYHHAFAVVVTPDCDLEQDFKARYPERFDFGDNKEKERFIKTKDQYLIPNMLFCPAATESEFRASPGINAGLWGRVKTNQHERFHHLGPAVLPGGAEGQPTLDLFLDFKRVSGVPLTEFYAIRDDQERRLGLIPPPYLQDLLHRFCSYQSRVALPDG